MKNLFLLVLVVLLSSCNLWRDSNIEKADKSLKIGMTKEQVIEILGYPDMTIAEKTPALYQGKSDEWFYHSEYFLGNSYPSVSIHFDKNGLYRAWSTGVGGGGGEVGDSSYSSSVQSSNEHFQTNWELRQINQSLQQIKNK